MYKQFFGLRENPFNLNPDPRYLFLTPQTREALDELTYGIQARQGLILLTGEVGTGKTTLIYRLLDWLHQQQTPTAFIFNSHLEISHLFDFILTDFGVPFDSGLKRGALMRLNLWLLDRYRTGETPVVIVDEAQGLPSHVLEEIRMLLNLETPREKLLQIVLAGQPELEERLKRPELRQIKQRIALRCKTAALTLEETHNYIRARLQIAGAGERLVFSPQAMDAVHCYSRGIPRVTNLLCEHALINAYVEHIQPVPAHIIAEVAREFQFDDIKHAVPCQDSVDALFSALIAIPETLASARVCPSAAASPILFHKQYTASTTGLSASSVAGPTVTPTVDCKMTAHLQEGKTKTTFSALGVPAPGLGASQSRRIEAPLTLGPTTSASDASFELLAELAMERTPLAYSSRLHVVEPKRKCDLSPDSTRCRLSTPQKLGQPPTTVIATKSASIASRRTTVLAFRSLLTQWSARWRDRFLSALTSPARTRRSAISQQVKQSLDQVRAGDRRRAVWRNRWLDIIESVDWARSKASVYRWLQQPSNPSEWRLADSHLFEARVMVRQEKVVRVARSDAREDSARGEDAISSKRLHD
jgi:general secretion pathway protein A